MYYDKKILIVGINPRNLELLSEFLNKNGYESTAVQTIEQIDNAIDSKNDFAMVLIDITGFKSEIWERCRKIHEQDIPVLIVASKQDTNIQRASIEHGATGILTKPLVMHELSDLIIKLMEG